MQRERRDSLILLLCSLHSFNVFKKIFSRLLWQNESCVEWKCVLRVAVKQDGDDLGSVPYSDLGIRPTEGRQVTNFQRSSQVPLT